MDQEAELKTPKMRARSSTSRTDLWLVASITLASFFIASALELREWLTYLLARFESWQADEIPLSLTVLATGLAWYAFRRRQETQAELVLREQAEARIADLLEHKRELAQQLISLQESERLGLARELHDELGQGCTAVRVETAFLANVVRDAADLDADTRTALLAAATRTDDSALALYQSVRDMLRRLRPANLDALGLAAALQELCESWAARTGVRCDYRADGDTEALGDEIDITVYRIAQEALTNVTRHARASHVQLSLTRDADDEVILTVQDDGRGMDASVATHGLGLLGAVERAAAVGADLSVASSPGAGVCISLRIALHQAQRIQQQRHEPYSATPTPTPTPTHVHASAEAQWPHAGAAQTATAATAINAINAMIPTAATTATTPADSDLGGAIRTWRRAA